MENTTVRPNQPPPTAKLNEWPPMFYPPMPGYGVPPLVMNPPGCWPQPPRGPILPCDYGQSRSGLGTGSAAVPTLPPFEKRGANVQQVRAKMPPFNMQFPPVMFQRGPRSSFQSYSQNPLTLCPLPPPQLLSVIGGTQNRAPPPVPYFVQRPPHPRPMSQNLLPGTLPPDKHGMKPPSVCSQSTAVPPPCIKSAYSSAIPPNAATANCLPPNHATGLVGYPQNPPPHPLTGGVQIPPVQLGTNLCNKAPPLAASTGNLSKQIKSEGIQVSGCNMPNRQPQQNFTGSHPVACGMPNQQPQQCPENLHDKSRSASGNFNDKERHGRGTRENKDTRHRSRDKDHTKEYASGDHPSHRYSKGSGNENRQRETDHRHRQSSYHRDKRHGDYSHSDSEHERSRYTKESSEHIKSEINVPNSYDHESFRHSRDYGKRRHESPGSHSSHSDEHGRKRHRDSSNSTDNSNDKTDSHSKSKEPDGQSKSGESLEVNSEDIDLDVDSEGESTVTVCTTPSTLFYKKDEKDPRVVYGTQMLGQLHKKFRYDQVERADRVKRFKPKYTPPQRKTKLRKPKPPKTENADSSSTSEESSSEEEDTSLEELEKKKKHPDRLHEELWFNDPGEMNDGPVCRCSAKASRSGIRHGIYTGETNVPLCDPNQNNADKLFHYRIVVTPNTNFLSETPTTIKYGGQSYTFEGFSMFSHSQLQKLPSCRVIRFNIEYTILYVEEEFPDNFTIQGLELFSRYLLIELLELVDLNWKPHNDNSGCPRFHFMPRFTRKLQSDKKELLSMNIVLQYLLNSSKLLVEEKDLAYLKSLGKDKWPELADKVKGMIVTCPGMKPSSIRVDQLDCVQCDPVNKIYPVIIHFGVRPPQLSYAGNPNYQKAWRDYVKFRHLLANKPKVVYQDRHRLLKKERRLQEMRMMNNLKRDVTVVVNSKNFYETGIMCDVVQHAMLLPVLVCHLRFHQSLDVLEEKIKYQFEDRYLLQLALTHPSYRENFGTNPDHARNSLTNCGIRQPEYGDRRIHYVTTRKRGINTLINIMSRFGRREETASRINHNERLEFLGDAVVEFLSSIHLFFMFPNLEEGGLATYRAAIVQNQHLALLAKKLQLEKFMLYAHGSDLCHDLELRHAMANCFEALMGALFLDSTIDVADRVFSETLFTESDLLDVWVNYPPHPLQEQEPNGDRKWLSSVPLLQKLQKFEEAIGIEFTHIRLLARALTHRSLGYNNLTLGSNQRLEFLGDTVLQLVASEYLYKYFPEHHEGHLSLLRSSLVNNRTQAVVCDDLGMVGYAIYPYSKVELKAKDRADLMEAFLGALYVDKGLGYCTNFCEVCFFPRLQDFIMNQEWNDPKSKLQQCCLTLRTMDGGEPDIPLYKVIECKGPTNTRIYTVAVYFRGKRLAIGSGHSIQQAEMAAAQSALASSKDLFPQLDHQRRALEKSLKQRTPISKISFRELQRM